MIVRGLAATRHWRHCADRFAFQTGAVPLTEAELPNVSAVVAEENSVRLAPGAGGSLLADVSEHSFWLFFVFDITDIEQELELLHRIGLTDRHLFLSVTVDAVRLHNSFQILQRDVNRWDLDYKDFSLSTALGFRPAGKSARRGAGRLYSGCAPKDRVWLFPEPLHIFLYGVAVCGHIIISIRAVMDIDTTVASGAERVVLPRANNVRVPQLVHVVAGLVSDMRFADLDADKPQVL